MSLHGGHQDYRLAVRDEEPWGDAPWVFVERGATGERDWLTEGSARTRSVQAWVLATPDLIPAGSGGACEALGTLADLNRMVYRISGEVELLTPQQDRYRIACRADAESAETLVVVGNPVPQSLQQRPLYCGLPHIHVFDTPKVGHNPNRSAAMAISRQCRTLAGKPPNRAGPALVAAGGHQW